MGTASRCNATAGAGSGSGWSLCSVGPPSVVAAVASLSDIAPAALRHITWGVLLAALSHFTGAENGQPTTIIASRWRAGVRRVQDACNSCS
jgi:hypothetical protein